MNVYCAVIDYLAKVFGSHFRLDAIHGKEDKIL